MSSGMSPGKRPRMETKGQRLRGRRGGATRIWQSVEV